SYAGRGGGEMLDHVAPGVGLLLVGIGAFASPRSLCALAGTTGPFGDATRKSRADRSRRHRRRRYSGGKSHVIATKNQVECRQEKSLVNPRCIVAGDPVRGSSCFHASSEH